MQFRSFVLFKKITCLKKSILALSKHEKFRNNIQIINATFKFP